MLQLWYARGQTKLLVRRWKYLIEPHFHSAIKGLNGFLNALFFHSKNMKPLSSISGGAIGTLRLIDLLIIRFAYV